MQLQLAHITPSTRKTYDAAWSKFAIFCRHHNYTMMPASEKTILRFIATLHASNTAPSTARMYLAGIANRHREHNLVPLTLGLPIKHAMDGFERLHKPQRDKRLPITLDLMRLLKRNLQASADPPQNKLVLWAAFTIAYTGLLRVSEFTAPTHHTIISRRTLLRKDITINKNSVDVRIRSSKTDQLGHGYRIALSRTGRSVCPVKALEDLLASRSSPGANDRPLFVLEDGRFLTRSKFSTSLQNLLRGIPDAHLYSPHSFRIGGTTTAAANGADFATIQKTGR